MGSAKASLGAVLPWICAFAAALALRYFDRVARGEPFVLGDELAGFVGSMVGCLIGHFAFARHRRQKAEALGLPPPADAPMTVRTGLLIGAYFAASLVGIWWFRHETRWVAFLFMLFLVFPLYAGMIWAKRADALNGPPPKQIAYKRKDLT